jgi:hypothetical protein
MANEKIRVPATTVELVQILGVILREHIKVELHGCECWTFEHVTDWDIPEDESIPAEFGDTEISSPQIRHQMEVYLATGYFTAFGHDEPGNARRVDTRVRCELSTWVPAFQSFWDFQIWFKLPDNSIEQHHYRCFREYGDKRDIAVENTSIPAEPPRKIAFWKNQTTA